MKNNPLQKLSYRVRGTDSVLCIGLDSDFERLPKRFQTEKQPQFSFNTWIIDQTHDLAAAYKINTAFYEARGAAGWLELELTAKYIRDNHPEIFLIADAKRADIGSTNQGYVTAFFDTLGFDAVTIHPYLGQEAVQPFLDRKDKVSIVLCKTSNPGSGEFQDMRVNGTELWQRVATQVSEKWNTNDNCMLVVGATYPEVLHQVRATVGEMWLLVPGVGEQGGNFQQVLEAAVNSQGQGVLINVSRSIIFSKNPRESGAMYAKGV